MSHWWDFGMIYNFGQKDPQGDYWKPDVNALTPSGFPVEAALAGTVTNVRWTDFGQTVITMKLDTPLNGLATHTFYEHMSNATVKAGQHVNVGDLLGHANLTGQGANLGFGFYSGDVYGVGPAWDILQKDLAPGGDGLLNPTATIKALKAGSPIIPTGGNTTPGSPLGNPVQDFMSGIGLPDAASVQRFAQRMALMFVGGTLLLIGVLVLFFNSDAGKKVAKTGAEAAVMA